MTETIEVNDEIAAVLNYRRQAGETYEDVLHRVLEETSTSRNLGEFLHEIASRGADFIAVPETSLANGKLRVIASAAGEDRDQLAAYVNKTNVVTIANADHRTDLRFADPYTGDLHFYRRIPVAAPDGIPGIDPVALEDGINNIQAFVAENQQPAPVPAETIPITDLVSELVANEATAVTVVHEPWFRNQEIEIKGYMPAAKGYDACGAYDTVSIDDKEYPLSYRFTRSGPNTLNETPLYVDDDVLGIEESTVDEGLDSLYRLLAADSRSELTSNRRPGQ